MWDLQNNPLFNRMKHQANQSASQVLYNSLINRPMEVIQRHKLVTSVPGGSMTTFCPNESFMIHEATGNINIGNSAIGAPNAILVPVIHTPMRAPNDPQRTSRTHRFAPGHNGAKLWITDPQTGCTVMVVDWGGTFSMIHLQPWNVGDYNFAVSGVMKIHSKLESKIKIFDLKRESKNVYNTTSEQSTGQPPQRYITIQSQQSLSQQRRLVVLGVAQGGTWNFYKQTIQAGGFSETIHSVEQLQWQNW